MVRPSGDENHRPDQTDQAQRQQLRGAAHVLGLFGERMQFERDAVDRRFDGRVEQLDDQAEKHHGN
jgi:hypothetical protein